ncbi:MAG: diaminopimelate epimerase [Lachnospiraceae bacterium]|nr:diaminopimelate epimerase [Lachnospiraceae bacterium]
MRFSKLQSCGNDYIYINNLIEKISDAEKNRLAFNLSNRHFGIGSDGLIFIEASDKADFKMEMYNQDGTFSEICGNGIRGMGKFLFDAKMIKGTEVSIESGGKIYYLILNVIGKLVTSIRVDMGAPELTAKKIPVISKNAWCTNEAIDINGQEYKMTCVSMGNPHAVIVYPDLNALDINHLGPLFENHQRFPKRTNVEFIEVIDRKNVRMRVWERGCGETLACGSGACAVLVACVLNSLTDDEITVFLPGGEIMVNWDREMKKIYLTGSAISVYNGEITKQSVHLIGQSLKILNGIAD